MRHTPSKLAAFSSSFFGGRWIIRVLYALDRLPKTLRLIHVRYWRRWTVNVYYRHKDHAPPPSKITLRTTNACNLRCVQCAQWGDAGVFKQFPQAAGSRHLTTEDWKRFIARLAPVCPHIYFFGGEPFLRKDLLELVRYASSLRVLTGVNTNGHFLKGLGEEIAGSGMDYLIVSLDGPREVNNSIRLGKSDGFAQVQEAVEELTRAKARLASRYPLIEICMTVTAENQHCILETARIAREMDADYFLLGFGIFTTREIAAESAAEFQTDFGIAPRFFDGFVRDVSRVDATAVTHQIEAVKALWGSRYKQCPPGRFDIEAYFHRPREPVRRQPCIVPWLTMQVMPDGRMSFCEDFADFDVGGICETDPLSLWNNAQSMQYRRRIRTKGVFPAESRCGNQYL